MHRAKLANVASSNWVAELEFGVTVREMHFPSLRDDCRCRRERRLLLIILSGHVAPPNLKISSREHESRLDI